MIVTSLALALAAAFTGAAAYISWAEQPARLSLDDASLLQEWKLAYAKGFAMQATLAVVSGLLGLAAFFLDHSWLAALGGVLMLANWPYTFLAIIPTNKRLGAMTAASAELRPSIEKWARLHAGRTLLGLVASCAFLIAQLT